MGRDEDGGERKGEDHAAADGEDGAAEAHENKVRVGQDPGGGGGAENRNPEYGFAVDAVADGAADESAGGDGGEEQSEEELGVLDRDVEWPGKVESEPAPRAGQVEISGENQRGEDGEGGDDAVVREGGGSAVRWEGPGGRGRTTYAAPTSAPRSFSVLSRSWPQAASISWPFSRRSVTGTRAARRTSAKRSRRLFDGRFQGRPATVL